MSTNTKYTLYRCDTCKRQTEILLDARSPDPNRCNITLRCRGKLERIGERATREQLFTKPVPGLEDFVPRGTPSFPQLQLTETAFYSVYTGPGMLTLAAVRITPGVTDTYYIVDSTDANFTVATSPSGVLPTGFQIDLKLFEITPEILAFNRYTYFESGSVQLIRGIDDSPEGRNLRFNSSNNVRVFVNGLELESGEFDRTVDDQITFTPAIFDSNNVVEILVYNDIDAVIDEETLVTLSFVPLRNQVTEELDLRKLNCWGDVGTVTGADTIPKFSLFCSDVGQLDENKSYGVYRAEVTTGLSPGVTKYVRTNEMSLLLGRDPYAFRDKDLHAFVPMTTLVDDDAVLHYRRSDVTGALQIDIDTAAVTQVYKPLSTGLSLDLENSESEGAASEAEKTVQDLPRRFIIGPS